MRRHTEEIFNENSRVFPCLWCDVSQSICAARQTVSDSWAKRLNHADMFRVVYIQESTQKVIPVFNSDHRIRTRDRFHGDRNVSSRDASPFSRVGDRSERQEHDGQWKPLGLRKKAVTRRHIRVTCERVCKRKMKPLLGFDPRPFHPDVNALPITPRGRQL